MTWINELTNSITVRPTMQWQQETSHTHVCV